MSEKIKATFIVPDHFTEISVEAVNLCELFVAKILDATESVIEIKVDEKSMVVISNNQSIKELVSMYLKSKRLSSFYTQLTAFAGTESAPGEIVLKIVLLNRMYVISVQELTALPSLHLRVIKMEAANLNQ